MNSIHLLQQYVEKQNKVWLSMEMDKGRGVDLADVEDPRVDLCLFCIQAHRLRPVDLRRVCSLLLVLVHATRSMCYCCQDIAAFEAANGALMTLLQ